jgi:hypothetical protein
MSEYIHKSHNVTVLLYHLVFPAKYRRAVFDEQVDDVLREVCLEIEKRYTVGKHGDEGMIAKYVKKQGNEYLKLHRDEQLALF